MTGGVGWPCVRDFCPVRYRMPRGGKMAHGHPPGKELHHALFFPDTRFSIHAELPGIQ